jgi:cysteine desulfurase / selenocysteine lyase
MSTSDRFGGVAGAADMPHASARPPTDVPSLPLGAADKLTPETPGLPSVEQMAAWANAFFQNNDVGGVAPGAVAPAPGAPVPGVSPAASGVEALPSVADPRRTAAAAAAPLTATLPTGLGTNEALAPQRALQPAAPYYFLAPEMPTHLTDMRITKGALAAQPLDAGPGLFDTGAPRIGAVPAIPSGISPLPSYLALAPAASAPGAGLPTSGAALPASGAALPGSGSALPPSGAVVPANASSSAPYYYTGNAPSYYDATTPDFPRAVPSAPSTTQLPSLQPGSDVTAGAPIAQRGFEISRVRADFPILHQYVNGRPLVWLDNAATTQKPNAVIERIAHFYRYENSNIHRGAHTLAARSTDAYEAARESVRRFLNAGSTEEIVFVRGATEGINLVASSWGGRFVEPGDEIIVSRIEHHSNIVPWKLLCERTGARLRVAEVDDTGQIDLDHYERLFNSHTRLVAFTHVSNALGTILPVQAMTQIAHRHGARVMIDGAQSVCHMPVDVQALDADFYVFSGHKVFGPTGIGVVYGKRALLAAMPPYQGGGNMIADVTFEKTVYNPPPSRFEAGTGNIADAVGLGVALDYLMSLGLDNVARHEHALLEYGTHALSTIPGLHFIGTAKEKAAVLGFVLENKSSEQVGSWLAQHGIAVRAGHHCAQPALRRFGHETTVRPSLAMYNDRSDVDALVAALRELQSTWPR